MPQPTLVIEDGGTRIYKWLGKYHIVHPVIYKKIIDDVEDDISTTLYDANESVRSLSEQLRRALIEKNNVDNYLNHLIESVNQQAEDLGDLIDKIQQTPTDIAISRSDLMVNLAAVRMALYRARPPYARESP